MGAALGTVVALAFAALLARRYLDRRRPPEILWSLALLMYAVASVALAGAADGWSTGEYRAYWLFGAVLTVPFLAMGEVYLLVKRRVVVTTAASSCSFAAAFALNRIRTATLVATALDADLPRGSRAWANDPFALISRASCPSPASSSCSGGRSGRPGACGARARCAALPRHARDRDRSHDRRRRLGIRRGWKPGGVLPDDHRRRGGHVLGIPRASRPSADRLRRRPNIRRAG